MVRTVVLTRQVAVSDVYMRRCSAVSSQVMPTVGAQYWLQGSHRAGFYEQEPTQGFSNKRHWRIVLASLLERVKRAALRDGFRPSHYPPLSAVLSRTLDGPLSGSCISFLHLGDSGMPASVQIHVRLLPQPFSSFPTLHTLPRLQGTPIAPSQSIRGLQAACLPRLSAPSTAFSPRSLAELTRPTTFQSGPLTSMKVVFG